MLELGKFLLYLGREKKTCEGEITILGFMVFFYLDFYGIKLIPVLVGLPLQPFSINLDIKLSG